MSRTVEILEEAKSALNGLGRLLTATEWELVGESLRRDRMWEGLLAGGGPRLVKPDLIQALGIYGGRRGIWVDKARTGDLSEDGLGITVGLYASEGAYPDLLEGAEGAYRYPETQIPSWDLASVNATKAAAELGIDVFIITCSAAEPTLRSVRPARVSGWDDDASEFTIVINEMADLVRS